MTSHAEARLLRAIAGDPTTEPVLRVLWAALELRLDLAATNSWVDRTDAEAAAADLAYCSPRLAAEVTAAAIGAGLVHLRRHHGRQQIRRAPQTPDLTRGRTTPDEGETR